ncbi:MAG: peptidase M3, partial [Duncaniella sp.]|nr:peptidase M3 [Duncaniella sp.]
MIQAQNPFFQEFNTAPHGAAPFDKITFADYEPAIDRGIRLGLEAVDAIVNNPEAPTFENTIVALEHADTDLNRVLMVFDPLLSALSDDNMMELSMKITPRLSDYSTSISLNEGLWKRVKAVYDSRGDYNLAKEDSMLLKRTYDSFVRNGAL